MTSGVWLGIGAFTFVAYAVCVMMTPVLAVGWMGEHPTVYVVLVASLIGLGVWCLLNAEVLEHDEFNQRSKEWAARFLAERSKT